MPLDKPTKPIPEYPGYVITENGDVYSTKTNKRLKPHLNSAGYLRVTLCKEGVGKAFLVHRLVARCWLVGTGETVNHKDGNRRNNSADNLEWLSYKSNSIHAIQDLGYRKKAKLGADDLDLIRWLHVQGNTHREIADLFGIAPSRVSQIRNFQHLKRNVSGTNAWDEKQTK